MKFQKNQILEAEIVDMSILGYGIAKPEDCVFFVQNAVVGERALIRVIKVAKNYCVARVEEILRPSPDRVEPCCSVHRRCGGCAFQHVSYERELEIKQNYVRSCFLKAGISDVKVQKPLSTYEICHYRNKAQFPLSLDDKARIVCGFFAGKTHKVQPIEHCAIQTPLFSEIANALCTFFTKHRFSVYDENTGEGLLRHLYLRSADASGEIMLCIVINGESLPKEKELLELIKSRFPSVKSVYVNFNTEKTNVVLGKEMHLLWGEEKLVDTLLNTKLAISPSSFYQVNHNATELLYQTAFKMADLINHDMILDLFCGIGSISLTSGMKMPILGVEIVPDAVEDAKFNAALNDFSNTEFICGDAKDAFVHVERMKSKNPIIVVDPPRKGLSEKLISDIATSGIQKVLYISCGPDTLARDVRSFVDHGFHFDSVQPVDLFPRTSHVESVVCLTK